MYAGSSGYNYGANKNSPGNGNGKWQGLWPSVGHARNARHINIEAGGNNRNVVFCMNQLGGVGRISNMFATTADGVQDCKDGQAVLHGGNITTTRGVTLGVDNVSKVVTITIYWNDETSNSDAVVTKVNSGDYKLSVNLQNRGITMDKLNANRYYIQIECIEFSLADPLNFVINVEDTQISSYNNTSKYSIYVKGDNMSSFWTFLSVTGYSDLDLLKWTVLKGSPLRTASQSFNGC